MTHPNLQFRPLRFMVLIAPGLLSCGGVTGPAELKHAASRGTLIAYAEPRSPALALLFLESASAEASTCPQLRAATATVDNVRLDLAQPGRWHPKGDALCLFDCIEMCGSSTWSGKQPRPETDPAQSTFEVQDSTDTWTMTVERLYATRSLARVGTELLHPGDNLDMNWSPSTDVGGDLSSAAVINTLGGSADGGSFAMGLPLTYAAGKLTLRLPTNIRPGTYSLTLDHTPSPAVSVCSGPASCRVEIGQFDFGSVTFTVE